LIAEKYDLGIFGVIEPLATFKKYAIGVCRSGAIEEHRDKHHNPNSQAHNPS
jgi:hypothetical protein